MLKRSPSLTEQVKSHIKRRILNEGFEDGRIPSETDLANELGVSRTTIRDALSRLELEGVIYRKQGAGTFVNEAGLQLKTRLEEIWAYEAMLEAHGYTPSTRIISIEQQSAPASIARDLNLSADAPVVTIQKLFLADEQPVIMTINHLPLGLITLPYSRADFNSPMYQFLSQFCQQHLTYYLSEIVPLNASVELAETLCIPPDRALICFDEIGYNQDNLPIIKAYSYFRDDLLRLRLIRRE
ncbi:MAG: GntR family transcriptional regulator [Anaerolineales bacterium]|nr:GntR family transcriptional regulator [Anaerolineales bacterium]